MDKEEKEMRKNLGANPYVYPQPVLIVATYGEDGTPDAMNVAYGGIGKIPIESRLISERAIKHRIISKQSRHLP